MIRITVDDSSLKALRSTLAGFSRRRLNAALATALTRTANEVRAELRAEMPLVFDRPTPFVLNGLRVWPATAARPVARVGFIDDARGGIQPSYPLQANVEGGQRRDKRLEAALRAAGHLPAGWQAVPGQGARLDAYGNMSRGQVIQVLSQLRIQLTAGYTRNLSRTDKTRAIASVRRAGGRFFVIPPGQGARPGVYQREFYGRGITPVIVFVQGVNYRRRWDFFGRAQAKAAQHLPAQLKRAIDEHIARLAALRGGSA